MGMKQNQQKIGIQKKWFDEIKAYSEYSGIPMATLMTRLWQNSKERKDFLKNTTKGLEIIRCAVEENK